MRDWFKFGPKAESQDSRFPRDASLKDVRYVVVDTELTSLDARSNRLLSIGAIAMDGARIRIAEQFYRMFNPGCEVPAAVLVHKLRPNDTGQGVPPEQTLAELRKFIEGMVLVGPFLNIDLKVLRTELGDEQHQLSNPAIDTARVHRWILQNSPYREDLEQQLANVSLAALAKIYNLDFHEAHHALENAFVTARLWQKQLAKLEAKITSLGQLLRVAKA